MDSGVLWRLLSGTQDCFSSLAPSLVSFIYLLFWVEGGGERHWSRTRNRKNSTGYLQYKMLMSVCILRRCASRKIKHPRGGSWKGAYRTRSYETRYKRLLRHDSTVRAYQYVGDGWEGTILLEEAYEMITESILRGMVYEVWPTRYGLRDMVYEVWSMRCARTRSRTALGYEKVLRRP